MARARNIKPGFFRNADLVELPVEARLLFIGLWTIADREGRLKDRPKQIKMEIFPADNYDCNDLIQQIADTGMLTRYEHGGIRYLQITNFTKHQNPHRDEQASTIPAQGTPDAAQVKEPAETPISDQITPKKHANEEDAPCTPDACTVHAPCTPDACTEVARLNPESLIPESVIPFLSTSAATPPKPTPEDDVVQVPPAIPPCPIDAILDAYAAELPMLAQPRRSLFRDGKDADALRQRWRWVLTSSHESGPRVGLPLATTSADAVAWFRRFFGFVAKSDFLTGNESDNKRKWQADFGWLVNKSNFAKVVQGNYVNKQKEEVAA